MDRVQIGNQFIGPDDPVYIVAEVSANHNQSLDRALEIIKAAAAAGANAIKIQTYTADTLTLDCDNQWFKIPDDSPWRGKTLHQLYREAFTPWEWHEALKAATNLSGLDFFSTPFDNTAVDYLEQLGVPAYKIASFEIVDLPLLRRVAQTGKPIILSTGMATADEIQEAVDTLRSSGARQIVLLKCTSAYPADPADMNLRTIPDMLSRFGLNIGLSDHSPGNGAAVAAVALGARVIEKHLTLRRSDGGPDSGHSMEPAEFHDLVVAVRQAEKALGKAEYGPASEIASKRFRRSLFVVENVEKGELFTTANVRSVRPSFGLHPRHLSEILGKRAAYTICRGTPLTWEAVEGALVIRDATERDADMLLRWRNDPDTRANSHNEAVISSSEHAEWFKASLASTSRRLFVMEFNGVPVGVVRADFRMDHCELSWTVAPEARGKGFGKAMVAKVARSLGGNVRAEVKQTNVASQSIAQAAGLRLERSNNGVLYFSGYVY